VSKRPVVFACFGIWRWEWQLRAALKIWRFVLWSGLARPVTHGEARAMVQLLSNKFEAKF
jgi:hypothetical protein